MKNKHYLIIATLLQLTTYNASAQEIVNYPYGNYMNWQCEDPANNKPDGRTRGQISFNFAYEYGEHFLIANPFNFSMTDTPNTCTIYGIAASIGLDAFYWNRNNPQYSIDNINEMSLNIYIYKATENESDIQLIKQHPGHINQGQLPDKQLQFANGDLLPIYEFYFDRPLTITGTFLVTLHSRDSAKINRFSTEQCYSAYDCFILPMKDHVVGWSTMDNRSKTCIYERHIIDDSWVEPYPLPDIRDGMQSGETQWLFPILTPYGTTAAPAPDETNTDVSLSPNPAADKVTVNTALGIRRIEITDMAGRTLIIRTYDDLPHTATLSINALPQGTYAVRVQTPQSLATLKLAVQ